MTLRLLSICKFLRSRILRRDVRHCLNTFRWQGGVSYLFDEETLRTNFNKPTGCVSSS